MNFDTQKTEAIVLSRGRRTPLANARDIRVGGNTVHSNKQATRWLGVWLDTKEAPRRKVQEGQERAEPATETRGTGRPLTRELPTGPSSMCPSSSPLRIGTVVEGRWGPWHQKPAGGCPEGDQPRSKTHTGSLSDDQPRSSQPGIRTQASACTTGQPPPALRPPARQPTWGRPSQGIHRSPGQHARSTTPVIPRVLERKERDSPT